MALFDSLFSTGFICSYLLFKTILSILVYSFGLKFYYDFQQNQPKSLNKHDKYPEFKRYDKFSFLRILFGFIFLFWIRILTVIGVMIFYLIALKICLIFLKLTNKSTLLNRIE